jgi:hypothetical protein
MAFSVDARASSLKGDVHANASAKGFGTLEQDLFWDVGGPRDCREV